MTDAENLNQEGAAEGRRSRVRSNVFLSYSHADKEAEWYKDVITYLEQLNVGGELELWDDREIKAGEDWLTEIQERLNSAIVAVFLVTPTFVTSEFITKKEVPELLERFETGGLIVHALIAQPSNWEEHPIGEFLRRRQLIHSPEQSLEEMDVQVRHRCLHQLVKRISEEIGIHRNRFRHERRDKLMDEIERQIGMTLTEEVAGGDTSIIYRARQGARDLAVKAMVSRTISDVGQDDIKTELLKCRGLQSPVFIRVHDVVFNEGVCVATADWVPGRSLKRVTEGAGGLHGDRKWWERATSIFLKVAEALAEGHERKLRYLDVNPANILLDRGEPRLYPIDFSSWVASAAHSQGVLAFTIEMLEYIAPEYLEKPAEREDLSSPKAEREARELEMTKKADQYALGMVALALLGGRPPVQVCAVKDVQRLLDFQRDPRGFLFDGKLRLEDQAWRRAMPGLARVIWKMLAPNPAHRWESMAVVACQLRALVSSLHDVPAHVSEAKDCYVRCLRGNDDFYRSFYEALFRISPDVKPKFKNIDMTNQRVVLDAALERMLNYRANQREPTTLTAIAKGHRQLDLSADHFEQFGHAFLEALETAGVTDVTRDAWEAILWPALEYMKAHATDQQAVEHVARWVATGMSGAAIAERLETENIPSCAGGPWTTHAVERLCRKHCIR